MAYKPILFNTDMVKAILDGRKTQTRRVVKDFAGEEITSILKPDGSYRKYGTKGWLGMLPDRGDWNSYCIEVRPPCEPGDILWVRETWHKDAGRYMYRANYADDEKFYRNGKEVQLRWSPSIHMPKEAARIFLCVKDVHVEQLREITSAHAFAEGVECVRKSDGKCDGYDRCPNENCGYVWQRFSEIWNGTINPADRDKYDWEANPWVWVIDFERCEKPEGWY